MCCTVFSMCIQSQGKNPSRAPSKEFLPQCYLNSLTAIQSIWVTAFPVYRIPTALSLPKCKTSPAEVRSAPLTLSPSQFWSADTGVWYDLHVMWAQPWFFSIGTLQLGLGHLRAVCRILVSESVSSACTRPGSASAQLLSGCHDLLLLTQAVCPQALQMNIALVPGKCSWPEVQLGFRQ